MVAATVTVRGEAVVRGKPDRVELSLEVSALEQSVEAALAETAKGARLWRKCFARWAWAPTTTPPPVSPFRRSASMKASEPCIEATGLATTWSFGCRILPRRVRSCGWPRSARRPGSPDHGGGWILIIRPEPRPAVGRPPMQGAGPKRTRKRSAPGLERSSRSTRLKGDSAVGTAAYPAASPWPHLERSRRWGFTRGTSMWPRRSTSPLPSNRSEAYDLRIG